MELDLARIGAVALTASIAAFFVGGVSKGAIGLGLPLVAVPVLASTIDPRVAIALMAIPTLSSNVWLTLTSGHAVGVVRRFWVLLIMLALFAGVGAQFLVTLDAAILSVILGFAVLAFCLIQFLPLRLTVSTRTERWLNPCIGALAGLMGGLSNFYGPPLVAYLVALRLAKDVFIATVALFFVVGGLPLYGSLAYHGVLTLEVLAVSMAATVIVFAGVAVGTVIRRVVRQEVFERILFGALFVIAINLIWRGLG